MTSLLRISHAVPIIFNSSLISSVISWWSVIYSRSFVPSSPVSMFAGTTARSLFFSATIRFNKEIAFLFSRLILRELIIHPLI
jgi:hypothetical protein